MMKKEMLYYPLKNVIRNKVNVKNLKALFWFYDDIVIVALLWKPKEITVVMHVLVGKEDKFRYSKQIIGKQQDKYMMSEILILTFILKTKFNNLCTE